MNLFLPYITHIKQSFKLPTETRYAFLDLFLKISRAVFRVFFNTIFRTYIKHDKTFQHITIKLCSYCSSFRTNVIQSKTSPVYRKQHIDCILLHTYNWKLARKNFVTINKSQLLVDFKTTLFISSIIRST